MKIYWACALVPLLGGCLALPEGLSRQAPEPTPALVADTKATMPFAERAARLVSQEKPLGYRLPPVPASPLISGSSSPPSAGDDLAEEEEVVDPEALEDSLVLDGEGQLPPENEGLTVSSDGSGSDFPLVENEKVQYYIDYFTGPGHNVFTRWLERSGRYMEMIHEVFTEEGLPLDLAYLAMIESGFNDRAYSHAHASGPWQFIQSTGEVYGLSNDWWRDERRDPVKSTRAAARHLRDLYQMFEGDWYLAVAAYNAGAGKMQRAVKLYGTRDFWEISHGDYLATETKNYLPKLIAAIQMAKDPEGHGFFDINYRPPMAFDTVTLPSTTDIEVIAELAGLTKEKVKELNPELKRWCTPPESGAYELRLPVGSQADFEAKFAQLSKEQRAGYARHQLKKGDTLLALARRYNTRVDDIVSLNQIKNPRSLSVGTELILPLQANAGKLPPELRPVASKASARPKSYKVRSGDNLWDIGRRFNVSDADLRAWNKLGKKSALKPGQTLLVSAPVEVKKWTGKQQQKVAAKKASSGRKVVYQVRQGDTLWGISRRFAVAADDILNWNNLPGGHVLQPGDRLTLLVQKDSRS